MSAKKKTAKTNLSSAQNRKLEKKKNLKGPYHIYNTKDGHIIHVYVRPSVHGGDKYISEFRNQNLNGDLVKTMTTHGLPSKKQIEEAGRGKSIY